MKAPYPSEGLVRLRNPPALEDVNLFNEGFVEKPLDQYWAGPLQGWRSGTPPEGAHPGQERQVVGERPILDRIIWRQMDSETSVRSFKNGGTTLHLRGRNQLQRCEGPGRHRDPEPEHQRQHHSAEPQAHRGPGTAPRISFLWTASRSLRHTSRSSVGPSRCPAHYWDAVPEGLPEQLRW